jgi:suppressor for copper-sensitivity B
MVRAMKIVFPLAAALAITAISPATAAVGAWASGSKAKVRILSAGVGADGRLAAGLEIVLPSGWKTYWRDPGTAGVAPKFDFAASKNVARADVAFPVPERSDDGFSVTNVYEEHVVLPVSIALTDPAKPVDLSAVLDLGVCQDVCVPDHVEAHLTVPPADADAATDKTLAAARALVPGPAEPGKFAVEAISRNGGTDGKPVFRIRVLAPAGTKPELFIEGPQDWAAYAPMAAGNDGGRALYDVKFSRTGAKTPIAGAKFRVTISAGGRAIDQAVGLD